MSRGLNGDDARVEEDVSFPVQRDRRGSTGIAIVVPVLLVGVLVAACSGGRSDSTQRPELTAERVTAWFGETAEVLHPCEESSKLVGDAIRAEAESDAKNATSIPIMLAAGEAVEECTALLDTRSDPIWDGLRSGWPEIAAALSARVESLLAVDQAALTAAATNLDNRALVGRVFEAARVSDAAATELEELVRSAAASFGVEFPAGETLYRWNPPDH